MAGGGVMDAQQIAIIALSIAVPALVGWVWALWQSHNALRLKVAEEYLKNESLDGLRKEIHELRAVVYRIAVKMEVPVFSESLR